MTNTKLFMPFFMAALLRVLTITSSNCAVNITATTPSSFIVLFLGTEKFPVNTIRYTEEDTMLGKSSFSSIRL